ncbi:MAG: hypothetical protein KIT73_19860, partial [Burkholderiales bacterium]|nr:hypothetical protein [Burkholderiales bacterium]
MDLKDEAVSLMSAALRDLKAQRVADGMRRLCGGLESLRATATPEAWTHFARDVFPTLEHPLIRLIHRDPMTRRAYEKPRGYPGDPGLFDYLYGLAAPDPETDPIAAAVCSCVSSSSGARSIRHRKTAIAETLGALSDARLRVWSVGCGYLRELDDLEQGTGLEYEAFHAHDHDSLSIEYVSARFPQLDLRHASIADGIGGIRRPTGIDFAYSVGITDGLPQEDARRLARSMFDSLRPGGTLFLANVATGFSERGYLETFMQWFPHYRDEAAMNDLAALFPHERIAGRSV